MKNINLTLILIIISSQIISAQSRLENKIGGTRTKAEYQKLGLLKKTDNFSFIQSSDTTILVYKFFIVNKRMIETSEEIVINHNNKSMPISDILGYYFLGIKNERFAIFDEGTTTTRGLMIYDLYTEKEVINITYHGNLVLENNSIHYKSEVEINDEKLKPKCPPDIEVLSYKIYLEEQYFDFHDLKIIHTGKYSCSFVE